MFWKCRHSHRNGEQPQRLLLILQPQILNFRAQGVCAGSRVPCGRLGQDDREFFPSVAAADVGGAKEIAKQVSQGLEHQIARIMAESVIESLEVVEVEKKNGG